MSSDLSLLGFVERPITKWRTRKERFEKEFYESPYYEMVIALIRGIYLALDALDSHREQAFRWRRRIELEDIWRSICRYQYDVLDAFENGDIKKTKRLLHVMRRVDRVIQVCKEPFVNETFGFNLDRIVFARRRGCRQYPHPSWESPERSTGYPMFSNIPTTLLSSCDMTSSVEEEVDAPLSEKFLSYDMAENHESTNSIYECLPSQNWFRLLLLEPGDFDDVILCHLKAFRRSSARDRYEALSYSRHQDEHLFKSDSEIICNGIPTKVNPNLERALRHLRNKLTSRVFWIDALCINQKDMTEKSQQVQTMSSIYSNASKTVIWIGQIWDSQESACLEALDLVCSIVNRWDQEQPARYWMLDKASRNMICHRPGSDWHEKHSKESDLQHPLQIMFSREWFHRRWVIQEVMLSRSAEVQFGHAKLSWNWVGLAAGLLGMNHDQLLKEGQLYSVYNAYLMYRLCQTDLMKPKELKFIQLLRLAARFECADPRDAIFALLGMPLQDNDPVGGQFIEPDYTMNEEKLLLAVAERLLVEEPYPLTFLCDAPGIKYTSRYENNYPSMRIGRSASWIPTWHPRDNSLLLPWTLGKRFDPAKGLKFKRRHSSCSPCLSVEGIHVSTVIWTGPHMTNYLREDWSKTEIGELFRSGAIGSQFETTLGLVSRTLCGGRDICGNREMDKETPLHNFAAYLIENAKRGNFSAAELKILSSLALNGNSKHFREIVDTVCANRCLFITVDGHLGLGPMPIAPGDAIYVFGGADMAFALRRDAHYHYLVGETYVDGLMDGEAVEAMMGKRKHKGPLDPDIFMKCVLASGHIRRNARSILKERLGELWELAEDNFPKLVVDQVNII